MSFTSPKAIQKINAQGALLVFPLNNQKKPKSIWSEFYPRTRMRWEWDSDGDDRVGKLWYLMKQLSDSRKVVYSKWYRGRATFFSFELFTALLAVTRDQFENPQLSPLARQLLECLESDSPLSTKNLKALTELRGKENEKFYNKGMKELFNKFLIVAYGEVDDGAFPSLAVGATRHLFEDLLNDSRELDLKRAQRTIDQYMPQESLFRKFLIKTNPTTNE